MCSKKKHWYDYLWIFSAVYLALGFFNILFAWLGLICFITPLFIAIVFKSKAYCGKYCGRGQMLALLGKKFKLSRNAEMPRFLKSNYFRYGFLVFFLVMFGVMLFNTAMVFSSTQSLKQAVTLFWTFKLPWQWAGDVSMVSPWAAQFAYGFYSIMLTSTLIGLISMILIKPRAWCVYCPMGTMTQLICKAGKK